jgi:hypothetical protein
VSFSVTMKIRVLFLIGLMWPFIALWAASSTDNPPVIQASNDIVQSIEPTVIESQDIKPPASILWGISITTFFLFVVSLFLIIMNEIYRKKEWIKIKRVLEHDHD